MSWQNIKSKDLDNLVRKLALEITPHRRAPHDTYWYRVDGKRVLKVTLPNIHGGSGSISSGFLHNIRNNLKLSTNQFEDLVECPLSAQEYEKIIRHTLGL
jgi:hypothetical protein